jgi:hypothetical protein
MFHCYTVPTPLQLQLLTYLQNQILIVFAFDSTVLYHPYILSLESSSFFFQKNLDDNFELYVQD